jgi:hypothetical protein
VPVHRYAPEGVGHETRSEIIGEASERVALHVPEEGGVCAARRPVDEVDVRRHDRDGDTVGREVVESEYELERRDAASGDDHFEWRSSS